MIGQKKTRIDDANGNGTNSNDNTVERLAVTELRRQPSMPVAMPAIRRTIAAFAAFVVSLALTAPARAVDYTDIWWARCAVGDGCDPSGHKNGSGVNLVQNEDVVFATFYISDAAKKPIWVSSDMHRTPIGTYVGNLYYSTGSFFGGPWNSSDFTATTVGTATFTPTSATDGVLTYSVSGVPGTPTSSVNWSIDRYTLKTIVLSGNYVGTGVVTTTGCNNSASNGTSIVDLDPQITQSAGQLIFILTLERGTCTLSGPPIQEGQLFRMLGASYICTNGGTNTLNTVANVYEVKATSLGIEGRWQANTGGGCQENGAFSGVLN